MVDDALHRKQIVRLSEHRVSSIRIGGGARVKVSLQKKILGICIRKIEQKGDGVGLSFYAFFANRNDDPVQLMEVATWWIQTHELDHFEKATKIRDLIRATS